VVGRVHDGLPAELADQLSSETTHADGIKSMRSLQLEQPYFTSDLFTSTTTKNITRLAKMVFITHDQSPDGLPVVPLWINGAAHETSPTDSLFPVTSSLQDKAIHNAVSATPSSAALACDAAAAAFTSWRKTAPSHRRKLLLKAADIVESKAEEIAGWQVAETSCPQPFADSNVKMGATWMREVAAATSELRGVVTQRGEDVGGDELGGLNIVVREPIGVVMIIPPYVF
jgi:hypothetical protein